jgi:hypothetical protein
VRILSETASCRIATPITVNFEQLRSGEGYDPRREAANFGPVWRGGEWRLRDITNHMTTAAFFLMKHAAQNREHWLQRFYEIGKEAVRQRKNDELIGLQFSMQAAATAEGNSWKLVQILERAGVEVEIGSIPGPGAPGQIAWVKMNQPYGGFARALLESQRYPDLRDSSGSPIPPYDVTAHSLALLMEIDVKPVYEPFRKFSKAKSIPIEEKEKFIDISDPPRTAIYKSQIPAIDEGWTRWAFENAGPNYSSIDDKKLRESDLTARYKTIIIPDQPRNAILNGYRTGAMPPEYTGGIGERGVKALREFVEEGGTLVCLNRASDFAIEQLRLPLRDVVAGLPRTEFYVPGSILRIELDTANPIAKGMPKESIAWAEDSPAFEILGAWAKAPTERASSTNDMMSSVSNVHVVAWYPKDRDPLLSGWLLGGERLKGKAALVEVTMGKGRVILFGFRPQYRGQSLATYPLLFNSVAAR